MSIVEPPPVMPGDDLEGLLRAFYRKQMPRPWPAPRASLRQFGGTGASPVSSLDRRAVGPTGTGRTLLRSRWALAASVALLALSSLLLPSRFNQDAKSRNIIGGPAISSDDIRRGLDRDHHKRELPADENQQTPEMDETDLPMRR